MDSGELEGLYKRLQTLEARRASDAALSRRMYRRGFSSGLTGGVMSLAVLALMGSLLYGQGGADALFINPQGRVGIGTTSPRANLDIQQATRTPAHPESVPGLYVTGDFQEAAGVEFRHSNGSQGIGFGFNTIYATGGNPSQNLNLRARGDGAVTVKGALSVEGLLRARGRYKRDNGGETTSEIAPRYHLSLTASAYAGSTQSIPRDTLVSLCGDADGCEVRLGMTRWGSGAETETASVSFLFYYSQSDGHWRSSAPSESWGIDGNGRTEHVRSAWDTCFFTDGTYSNRAEADSDMNMQLLVWDYYKGASRTCELTLID